MTHAAAFAIMAAHHVTVGPSSKGWIASCLIAEDAAGNVMNYFNATGDTPLAAVEALAIERGWRVGSAAGFV